MFHRESLNKVGNADLSLGDGILHISMLVL